jgi:hypothetical protein
MGKRIGLDQEGCLVEAVGGDFYGLVVPAEGAMRAGETFYANLEAGAFQAQLSNVGFYFVGEVLCGSQAGQLQPIGGIQELLCQGLELLLGGLEGIFLGL